MWGTRGTLRRARTPSVGPWCRSTLLAGVTSLFQRPAWLPGSRAHFLIANAACKKMDSQKDRSPDHKTTFSTGPSLEYLVSATEPAAMEPDRPNSKRLRLQDHWIVPLRFNLNLRDLPSYIIMNAYNGVVTEWNGVGGISRGNLKEETAENDLGVQFFMSGSCENEKTLNALSLCL